MGETTSKIEAHIESTRADLGANLEELEQRVKAATDWKHQFQHHPWTMIGVAFGGGVVLAAMLGRGKSSKVSSGTAMSPTKRKTVETIDSIKDALIGVAAMKVKDFVGDIVPGFHEELRRTEERLKASLS